MLDRITCKMIVLLTLVVVSFPAMQAHAQGEGLVIKQSDFGVTKTLDRLGMALERKGIKVFARIDHAKGAESVGLELPPTSLIIFGNPKMGTPLMASNPAIGLDLPLKAIAWKDGDGTVKLAYTEPSWLAKRYGISDRDKVFKMMTGALDKFTDMATTRGALPAQ
ncbi:DUF302 domain-containing protein [Sneathiella marina]|uniref:DUF302 domain-containing protein n=1 Tax=Sneathiella marina TaxID=2950108 RepID=A0ABY4W4I0_9PROT|nr:DUF302 domain-containing protein [Sneathiella marina]USG60199.1 DUF302 domain-containing protein [Sneathiella marina]